jgi:osmoprotectant transport system ATP-binding protein
MADTPAVELKRVTKVFPGGIHAVNDVSVSIPPGRIVALLGASGCGKTTTLRLINRLEEASSGQVLVRGKDVRNQPPALLRRSIGYVIQEGGLFPHLKITANVATVPRLLGWARPRIQARVAEVLEMVGLPESQFGRRMPAELSGGQRQRVGVARALAADPDILLMDEPFGALDPGTREAIQDEFLRLNARLRKTVVIVTHDIAEAGKLADHIVLMDRGRIIQEGTLRELLVQPAGERVKAFLGNNGPGLALNAVRFEQILDKLRIVPATERAIHVPAASPLGQVLVAVAEADENVTIVVNGGRAYSGPQVRAQILAEVGDKSWKQ